MAVDPTEPIDCVALRAAGEAIQQLLAENCPIAESEESGE